MSDVIELAGMIASIPHIVSNIFIYLPMRDLHACSITCKNWNELAIPIKEERKYKIGLDFHHSYDQKEFNPFQWKSNCNQGHDCMLRSLVESPCQPSISLMFCALRYAAGFLPRMDRYDPLLRKEIIEECESVNLVPQAVQYFENYIPENSEAAIFLSRSLTAYWPNAHPEMFEFFPSLSSLYFPSIPGVHIQQFQLTGNQSELPDDTSIKCLLLFLRESSYDVHSIRQFVNEQRQPVALGGAFMRRLLPPQRFEEHGPQSYGISFSGENVEAASIVIYNYMTDHDIREKLLPFKNTYFLQGQCMALSFHSWGRGIDDEEKNWRERQIFYDVFPTIPLYGIFGEGNNHIGENSHEGNYIPMFIQNYAATFIILSFRT